MIIQSVRATHIVNSDTDESYRAAIEDAAKQRHALCDYGTAHSGLGHAPPASFTHVVAPSDIFEHWKADMGLRVSGGMRFSEVQGRLAEAGQFLPLDADGDMTVAEIIAHNVYGSLRLTHGTCRDLLLGLRYVDPQGQWVRVGGKTVKNVAGYDVTRLFVGSMNTLGLIADANLRTAVIPHHVTRLAVSNMDLERLDALMTDLLTCDASPCSLQYEMEDRDTRCVVVYAGTQHGCTAQFAAFKEWLAHHNMTGVDIAANEGPWNANALGQGKQKWTRDVGACVKAVVPPVQSARLLSHLRSTLPGKSRIEALPVHGVIHAGGMWTLDESQKLNKDLLVLLKEVGGHLTWTRRPLDSNRIDPFAPEQSDWGMLRKIKSTMDPHNLFNPGRFI